MRIFCTCVLTFAFISGCSTHPLVEDFARKNTYDIIKSIRCEAREGILSAGIPVQALHPIKVGFDFEFDITETNRATDGKLSFLNPFGGGKFSLDVTGGVEKSRNGKRTLRIVENFYVLAKDTACNGPEPRIAHNIMYPVTGRIGMLEIVDTFWRLNRLTYWNPNVEGKGVPTVFSDELKYTTTINAGISPNIELNAGAADFKLRNASIKGASERKDIHRVTVAISTSPREPSAQMLSTIVPGPRALVLEGARAIPAGDAGTANVILELDRLRNQEDERRILENLNLIQ